MALVQLYTSKMSIGARLRELRKQNELSQERFGELCDVSKGMVSQWESNLTTPPSDRLIELRKHLSFSVDWVLTGEIQDYTSRMKQPVRELLKVAEKLPDDMVAELTREGMFILNCFPAPRKTATARSNVLQIQIQLSFNFTIEQGSIDDYTSDNLDSLLGDIATNKHLC